MKKDNFIATISMCTKEELNDIIKKNGKKKKITKPLIYRNTKK